MRVDKIKVRTFAEAEERMSVLNCIVNNIREFCEDSKYVILRHDPSIMKAMESYRDSLLTEMKKISEMEFK